MVDSIDIRKLPSGPLAFSIPKRLFSTVLGDTCLRNFYAFCRDTLRSRGWYSISGWAVFIEHVEIKAEPDINWSHTKRKYAEETALLLKNTLFMSKELMDSLGLEEKSYRVEPVDAVLINELCLIAPLETKYCHLTPTELLLNDIFLDNEECTILDAKRSYMLPDMMGQLKQVRLNCKATDIFKINKETRLFWVNSESCLDVKDFNYSGSVFSCGARSLFVEDETRFFDLLEEFRQKDWLCIEVSEKLHDIEKLYRYHSKHVVFYIDDPPTSETCRYRLMRLQRIIYDLKYPFISYLPSLFKYDLALPERKENSNLHSTIAKVPSGFHMGEVEDKLLRVLKSGKAKRILVVGNSGTGKTHVVRSITSSLGVPVTSVHLSDVIKKEYGEGARTLRSLLQRPFVVLDEFDMYPDELVALVCNSDSTIICISRKEISGRMKFDYIHRVPDSVGLEQRRNMFYKYIKDCDELINKTEGWNISKLKWLINEAGMNCIRSGREDITLSDFETLMK
jgi:hypothetical protein